MRLSKDNHSNAIRNFQDSVLQRTAFMVPGSGVNDLSTQDLINAISALDTSQYETFWHRGSIDVNKFNTDMSSLYTDLENLYRHLDVTGDFIHRINNMNIEAISVGKAQQRAINDKYFRYVDQARQRYISTGAISESFQDVSSFETPIGSPYLFTMSDGSSIPALEVNTEAGFVTLPVITEVNYSQTILGTPRSQVIIEKQLGGSERLASGVYNIDNVNDGNMSTFWAEVVLADEQINIPWKQIDPIFITNPLKSTGKESNKLRWLTDHAVQILKRFGDNWLGKYIQYTGNIREDSNYNQVVSGGTVKANQMLFVMVRQGYPDPSEIDDYEEWLRQVRTEHEELVTEFIGDYLGITYKGKYLQDGYGNRWYIIGGGVLEQAHPGGPTACEDALDVPYLRLGRYEPSTDTYSVYNETDLSDLPGPSTNKVVPNAKQGSSNTTYPIIGEITRRPFQITSPSLYRGGAACAVRIDFEHRTTISEIDFTPFGEFPVEVLAVLYSESGMVDIDTAAIDLYVNDKNESGFWTKHGVRLRSADIEPRLNYLGNATDGPTRIRVKSYDEMVDPDISGDPNRYNIGGITAKHVWIIINQPTSSYNTYNVPISRVNDEILWSIIKYGELHATAGVSSLDKISIQERGVGSVDLADLASDTISSLEKIMAIGSMFTGVKESAHQDYGKLRGLSEEVKHAISYLQTLANEDNEDTIQICKYEYTYGAFEISCRLTRYLNRGRYISKPLVFNGEPRRVWIIPDIEVIDDNISVYTRLLARPPSKYADTTEDYYIGEYDWEGNSETPIYIVASDPEDANHWATETVPDWLVTPYDNTTPGLITVAPVEQVDTFKATDAFGRLQLSSYPYINQERINNIEYENPGLFEPNKILTKNAGETADQVYTCGQGTAPGYRPFEVTIYFENGVIAKADQHGIPRSGVTEPIVEMPFGAAAIVPNMKFLDVSEIHYEGNKVIGAKTNINTTKQSYKTWGHSGDYSNWIDTVPIVDNTPSNRSFTSASVPTWIANTQGVCVWVQHLAYARDSDQNITYSGVDKDGKSADQWYFVDPSQYNVNYRLGTITFIDGATHEDGAGGDNIVIPFQYGYASTETVDSEMSKLPGIRVLSIFTYRPAIDNRLTSMGSYAPLTKNVTDYVKGTNIVMNEYVDNPNVPEYYPVFEYTQDGSVLFLNKVLGPDLDMPIHKIEVKYRTLDLEPRVIIDIEKDVDATKAPIDQKLSTSDTAIISGYTLRTTISQSPQSR